MYLAVNLSSNCLALAAWRSGHSIRLKNSTGANMLIKTCLSFPIFHGRILYTLLDTRGGLGLSPSPKVGLGLGFLLYKAQSPSTTGQKNWQSLTGRKIQSFRPKGPEKNLLVLFS
jgi:hypothetical protein